MLRKVFLIHYFRLGIFQGKCKNAVLCIVFFSLTLPLVSQTNYFQKTIGGSNNEDGYYVQQTTDGGFITIGSTQSYGTGGSDVYLVKTSVNGNVIWSQMFGGNNQDEGFSGQQTADGGYIITGYTNSYGNGKEVLLIKTNNLGVLQWSKDLEVTTTSEVIPSNKPPI